MNKEYHFYDEEPIYFDDEKTVRELIEYASAKFGYCNFFTADFATLFLQDGGFISDTALKCCQAISDNDTIYPACYIPDTMCHIKGVYMERFLKSVGISSPVILRICLDDISYRICFNGSLTLSDLQRLLIKSGCAKRKEMNATVEVYPYEREVYTYNMSEKNSQWHMTLKEIDQDFADDCYTEAYYIHF